MRVKEYLFEHNGPMKLVEDEDVRSTIKALIKQKHPEWLDKHGDWNYNAISTGTALSVPKVTSYMKYSHKGWQQERKGGRKIPYPTDRDISYLCEILGVRPQWVLQPITQQ